MTEEADIARLYRHSVLEHSRHPRNFRRPDKPERQATGHNPLCGDRLTIYLDVGEDQCVRDASFEAVGCAISIASASMLTEMVRNRRIGEVNAIAEEVAAMFADPPGRPPGGDIAALAGVRGYPSRIRCATLPWKTLQAALQADGAIASTE